MADERVMCKYGEACYQRNSEHHNKYRHPKKRQNQEPDHSPKKKKTEENIDSKTNSSLCHRIIYEIDTSCDIKHQIEHLFLVKMPDDFFSFYSFCKSLSSKSPCKALVDIGLELVGPFHIFEKDNLKPFSQSEALRHFRYYFDPPEFQTVLKAEGRNDLHYGYFRDDPKEVPSFVGSNEAALNCTIKCVGDNLFSVLNFHLDKAKKIVDPFKKIKLQKVQNALSAWAKKDNITLDTLTEKIKKRRLKIVTKTFHSAGIVVPFNKRTEVGYRELTEKDNSLKKILESIVAASTDEERKVYWTQLQPVITAANIANDEFDFGTSLELGINLFCFGGEVLHKAVLRVLKTSYELLERPEFTTILSAHLENRVKSPHLNTITL